MAENAPPASQQGPKAVVMSPELKPVPLLPAPVPVSSPISAPEPTGADNFETALEEAFVLPTAAAYPVKGQDVDVMGAFPLEVVPDLPVAPPPADKQLISWPVIAGMWLRCI